MKYKNNGSHGDDMLRLQKLLQDIDRDIPIPDKVQPSEMQKLFSLPLKKKPISKYIAIAASLILVLGCVVSISMYAGAKLATTDFTAADQGNAFSSTATADAASPETAVVSDLDSSLADRELTELKAKDYEEIAEVLAPFEESGFLGGSDGGTAQNINPPTAGAGNENGADSSSEIKPNPNTAGGDTDEKLARDQTNTQVDGVSEADIVKTDGDYIYYSTTDTIDIVLMGEDGDMEHVAKIKDQEFCYTLDLFLHESKLVVLASSNTGLDSQRKMAADSSGESRSSVKITIYDVSDPSSPQVDRILTQEGDYKDARMIGSQLYVVSQDFMYLQETNKAEPSSFIPSISDSSNTSLQMLPADSIYLLPQIETSCYNIISAVDVTDASSAFNTKAILGSSSQMYVSTNSMYLVSESYDNVSTISYSNIYKVELSGSEIALTASGRVKGSVLNQFSMDEYDGYFRIATQLYDARNNRTTNNLYVLDENLSLFSYLENIAEGEEIKSVRFMGNKVYLVTFRQVDPLFAIDLSDPSQPVILGQLKIPGFSTYMHPISDNLIVGLGYDTQEIDDGYGNTFTVTGGIKLSLFDVSDMENPTEINYIIVGDVGSDSPALYDHKAFLYYEEKGIIGIPATLTQNLTPNAGYYDAQYENVFNGYLLFQISDGKLTELGRITHQSEEAQQDLTQLLDQSLSIRRGVYRGDYIYTISDLKIKSTGLNDMKDVKEVSIG